ncbi:hypothetical protein [Sphingopyxis macrogoltabida]|uniref:Uncharacterized protein n=1 Tax=Sphingopyxis macrogoltabida TaxID=33050 RepID=A0A0N9V5B3_SPHMC|nr:hypothetical protein [Sphingopyxis macrogoltabida]ALH82918.1 hypothetical protein AN936_21935 [Sphingopyxis macrogoltabida]
MDKFVAPAPLDGEMQNNYLLRVVEAFVDHVNAHLREREVQRQGWSTDRESAMQWRIDLLETALGDLLSWFPDKPSDPEWRIKGGNYGADDAVEFARGTLSKSGVAGG